MSKICPLYSSSSGNSTYIGTKNGAILIDAGASFKGICENLCRANATTDELLAVAVTHEHTDHVKGLKTLLNKTGIPLIASKETAESLVAKGLVPPKTEVIIIDEKPVEICGTQISRFKTSHDCDGSSGYTLSLPDQKRISVCTDLGIMTDSVKNSLLKSDLVLDLDRDATLYASTDRTKFPVLPGFITSLLRLTTISKC